MEELCKEEVGQVTIICEEKNACVEAKSPGITTDAEYFERYSEICGLLKKKDKAFSKMSKTFISLKKAAALPGELINLNTAIKEKINLFWTQVDEGLKSGKVFIFEDFAKGYSLNRYEKSILLFFLYMEFTRPFHNVYSENKLIALFDLEDNILLRMKSSIHFAEDAPLIKARILTRDFVGVPSLTAVAEYGLNSRILDKFVKTLNGIKEDPKEGGSCIPRMPCTEIGNVQDPAYTLDDVVINAQDKENLLLFIDAFRDKRLETVGISKKIKKGKGLVLLFYGPPGTGKSMLAEAVAAQLNKKLLVVDYSKVLDRWVGGTDKRIKAAFDNAEKENFVLLMDEVDSLLYNRSYAGQEHDIRFVNDMLRELENFEGTVVLTTNMDTILDPAVERRISLKIKFELPDKTMRTQIWKSHMPEGITIDNGVDFELLANRYEFSGGYIKNAMLTALRRLTLRKETILKMDDLIFAAETEQKGMFIKNKEKRIQGFSERY